MRIDPALYFKLRYVLDQLEYPPTFSRWVEKQAHEEIAAYEKEHGEIEVKE